MSKEKKKDIAQSFNEIGTIGLNSTGGTIQEEFIRKLQWPQAGQIYQEMTSNDPVISAILLVYRSLMKGVHWDVEPADDTPIEREKAEFLFECMHDMSHTWEDFIDDMASYLEYGFSYHEIVYKKREGPEGAQASKHDDQRIGWRKFPGRAQTSLSGWEFDDEGGIEGVHQGMGSDKTFIPLNRSLLFRTTTRKNNPEGLSILRGAYRPWYFKKHIEEIEGIGIERDLAGLPVLKVPEGLDIFDPKSREEKAAAQAALQLVTSIKRDKNEGVVLPFGYELDLLTSGSQRQFNTTEVINRYDQRIAIVMLADIVMLGADKVGSFALAKAKQGMLAASLDAQMDSIVEILNRYAVPRLFAFNTFANPEMVPEITVSPVVVPELDILGQYIERMSGAGILTGVDNEFENYVRRAAGLPEIPKDAEERDREEKKSDEPNPFEEEEEEEDEKEDEEEKEEGEEEDNGGK